MKGVSSIVGAVIAIVLLSMVMAAYASYYARVNSVFARALRGEKEFLRIQPYINGSSIYFSIMNPGPMDPVTLRYVIVKNLSDGRILWVRELWRRLDVGDSMDFLLFNTTSVKGRIDIIAVTDNGGVFHLDPEYTGGDGVLDPIDVDVLLQEQAGSGLGSSSNIVVNPVIGWAFDKSTVIKYYNDLYYLINYTYGINRSVVNVYYDEYSGVSLGTVYFFDPVEGEYVSSISFSPDNNNGVVVVSIRYSDGSSKVLSGSNVLLNFSSYRELTLSYPGYNVTVGYRFILYKVVYSGAYDYYLYFRWRITALVEPVESVDSIFVRVASYYRVTVSYTVYGYTYTLARYYPTQVIHNTTKASTAVNSQHGEARFFMQFDKTLDNIKASFYVYRLQHIVVFNPRSSLTTTVEIPYQSYDLYQLDVSPVYPIGTRFVRIGNNTVLMEYENYLFPGSSVYRVTVELPYLYALNISQGDQSLPRYLILISNADPLEVINVSSSNPYLASMGLLESGDTITFKYKSLVFVDNSIWFSVYEANSTLVLQNSLIIIPVEGPYRGTEYYIWAGAWELLSSSS